MKKDNRATNIKILKVFGYIFLAFFIVVVIAAVNRNDKYEQPKQENIPQQVKSELTQFDEDRLQVVNIIDVTYTDMALNKKRLDTFIALMDTDNLQAIRQAQQLQNNYKTYPLNHINDKKTKQALEEYTNLVRYSNNSLLKLYENYLEYSDDPRQTLIIKMQDNIASYRNREIEAKANSLLLIEEYKLVYNEKFETWDYKKIEKHLNITLNDFSTNINNNLQSFGIDLQYEPKGTTNMSFNSKLKGKYIRNNIQTTIDQENKITFLAAYIQDPKNISIEDSNKIIRAIIMTVSSLPKEDVEKTFSNELLLNIKVTANMNVDNRHNYTVQINRNKNDGFISMLLEPN